MASLIMKLLTLCLPLAIILTNTPTISALSCFLSTCTLDRVKGKCEDDSILRFRIRSDCPAQASKVCSRTDLLILSEGVTVTQSAGLCDAGLPDDTNDKWRDLTASEKSAFLSNLRKQQGLSDAELLIAKRLTCDTDYCNKHDFGLGPNDRGMDIKQKPLNNEPSRRNLSPSLRASVVVTGIVAMIVSLLALK